jgi:hypothetical protein
MDLEPGTWNLEPWNPETSKVAVGNWQLANLNGTGRRAKKKNIYEYK